MPIGLSEEHEELRRSLRRWVESRCPPAVTRAALDVDDEPRPPFWDDLAEQGWLAVHVAEELGGHGFGVLELVVVLEELGRAVAPGPFLPTALAASVIARGADRAQAKALLPPLVEGARPAAVALGHDPGRLPAARPGPDGGLSVTGAVPAVLGGASAGLLVLAVRLEDRAAETVRWCAVDLADGAGAPARGVRVVPRDSLDRTRRSAEVHLEGLTVPPERLLEGVSGDDVDDLAAVLAAAELTGSARWCLETATEHARTRVQFGRPIGQFQGIKHKLADLLALVEQMTAATWDAALALDGADPAQAHLSASAASALALEGGVRAAKDAIQVLGGMGFTWEHDAHLHLRRAATWRQLLGGAAARRASVARQALGGARRALAVELPAGQAEPLRADLGPLVAEVAAAAPDDRRRLLGERGLLFPHWPAPYGRGVRTGGAAGDRRAAGRRRDPASPGPRGRLGPAHPDRPRHRRPAASASCCRPCAASCCGASCSASRGRAATWPRSAPGRPGPTAAGSSTARRSGPRWPPGPTWASAWPGPTPTPPSTRASPTSWSTCGSEGHRGPAAPGDHRGRAVQRGLLRRPVRARRLRGRRGQRRLAAGPHDAGQRTGVARLGLGLRRLAWRRSSAMLADDGRRHRRRRCSTSWVGCWSRPSPWPCWASGATLRSVSGLEPGPESSVRKLLGAEHEQRVADFGLERCGPAGVFCRRGVRPLGPGLLAHLVPDHRRGHQRGAAQRHRRAPAGAAPRPGAVRAGRPGQARRAPWSVNCAQLRETDDATATGAGAEQPRGSGDGRAEGLYFEDVKVGDEAPGPDPHAHPDRPRPLRRGLG